MKLLFFSFELALKKRPEISASKNTVAENSINAITHA